MALIIESTTNNPIRIKGTAIDLLSVYNRLEFECRADGITMNISFYTYADHTSYLNGDSLPTDLPMNNLIGEIDPLTQTQDLTAAHSIAKTYYESLGYVVSIDLV
jgi:hypothetical protein